MKTVPSALNRKRTAPRGIALFAILGLLVVLTFLFFSFHSHSLQLRHTTVNLVEEEVASQMAKSCSDLFWTYLEDVVRERRGCETLYPDSGVSSPLLKMVQGGQDRFVFKVADLEKKEEFNSVLRSLENELPSLKFEDASIEADFTVSRLLGEVVYGKAEMKIKLKMKQKTSYSFTFPRFFKLFHLHPLVPSKFTLFVKNTPSPECFNVVNKTYQQDLGDKKLLTLFNTTETFTVQNNTIWERSGWVFLGGTEVNLNLDGTHPGRSEAEAFLFWPRLYGGSQQNVGTTHVISGPLAGSQLRSRVSPLGCVNEWVTDPNMTRVVGTDTAPLLKTSSLLRLYGNKSRMTPTRVFGNVAGRYVLYATLIYDPENDGEPNTANDRNGVSQKMVFPLPTMSQGEYDIPLTWNMRLKNAQNSMLFADFMDLSGNPLVPGIPRDGPTLFPGYQDYRTAMTKVSTDMTRKSNSYNTLYDIFFDAGGLGSTKSFPPPDAARRFTPDDYPNYGTNVTLKCGNATLHEGDVTAASFDPVARYQGNIAAFSHQYGSAMEFLAEGPVKQAGSALAIDQPLAAFIAGDLDLSPGLTVTAPVVIVVEGNITVGNLSRRVGPPGAFSAGRLVLISLHGNIHAVGEKMEAQLIAPKGTLTWTNHPLDLVGSLYVRTLNPSTIEALGGSIIYDNEIDPTVPKNFLRGFTMVFSPKMLSSHMKVARE